MQYTFGPTGLTTAPAYLQTAKWLGGICGSLLDDEERAASRDEGKLLCAWVYPAVLPSCDKTRSLDRVFDRYNVELVVCLLNMPLTNVPQFGPPTRRISRPASLHTVHNTASRECPSCSYLRLQSLTHTPISTNPSAPLSSRPRPDRVVN